MCGIPIPLINQKAFKLHCKPIIEQKNGQNPNSFVWHTFCVIPNFQKIFEDDKFPSNWLLGDLLLFPARSVWNKRGKVTAYSSLDQKMSEICLEFPMRLMTIGGDDHLYPPDFHTVTKHNLCLHLIYIC